MLSRLIIFICISMFVPAVSFAGEQTDSLQHKGSNIINRVIDYFNNSNQSHPEKAFDISFIGGPHYSSDTKFGLGVVAAGVYRHDRRDSLCRPSNVSLYADATTSLFFMVGIRGTHFFPGDSRRISYNVNFQSVNSYFWGIGYACGANEANKSKYKYLTSNIGAEYVWRTLPNLYVGPRVTFNYIDGKDFADPDLIGNRRRRTFSFGGGLTVQYDTRDNITATKCGSYIKIDQIFDPSFIGNRQAFNLTELSASTFHPVWRDATLAANVHTRLTYGDTPWGLLSTFGGSSNMRGYFEGRYRDKNEIDLCVELRQHIWHRNGAVVWIGGGTIFPSFSSIRSRHLLPNYGLGYRWEFKRNINVRLDYGIGRGESGFIFSINEAF